MIMILCVNLNLIIKISKPLVFWVFLGLKWRKIQDKFKILVKKFHPDINAEIKHEEKLKQITLAYTQLKNTYREKIDT